MAEGPPPEPVLTGKNISFLELTSERASEIQKLTDAIENPNRTKMVYQRLPRHMQRRAMSHDPKRLPVRARQAFKEQRDMTQLKVSKRPSRRHRRRPSNLLAEYNRRQRQQLWLETHIWHARRFHMVQRWGFKLPERATDKGFRAAYRATAHHCLVQDVSYLCQLELCGPEPALLSALTALGGTGAGSARLLTGRHQGRVLLTSAEPPHRPLAPVSLLWHPADRDGDGARDAAVDGDGDGNGDARQQQQRRRLWLWVHPAGYEAVRDALLAVMGLTGEPEEVEVETAAGDGDGEEDGGDGGGADCDEPMECDGEDNTAAATAAAGTSADASSIETKTETSATIKTNTTAGSSATEEAKTSDPATTDAKPSASATTESKASASKKNVDQIKLAPRRLHILRRWSSPPTTSDTSCMTPRVQLTELKGRLVQFRLTGPGSQAVLQSCLRVAAVPPPPWETSDRLESQRLLWKRVGAATSPAELPEGCVLGLTVDDPRRHMPQQRTMATQRAAEDPSEEPIADMPAGAEISPLWDESVRQLVTTTKISDNQLNRARAQLLVPSASAESLRLSPVPALLIQRSRAVGWDLIIPPGWGMAFWVALQYSGARAGGLRETERLALETGEMRFPAEYPDSAAGRVWEQEEREKSRVEYFKHPPAKRPNFAKLRVPDPFSCWWTRLVARLCPPTSSSSASGTETGDGTTQAEAPLVCRDQATLRLLSTALQSGSGRPAGLPTDCGRLLVAIRVRATGRGVPLPGALLCLPNPEDNPASPSAVPITEPPADDTSEETRDRLRAVWLKKQAKEKRRRHRCRRRQQADKARQAGERMAEARQKQQAEMERLSLPAGDQWPSRQLIGHVTSGDFCLSEAVGLGTGFVVMEGLLRLLDGGGGPRLLFRNTDTDTCRWCTLTLVTERC